MREPTENGTGSASSSSSPVRASEVSYALRELSESVRHHDRAMAQRMRLKPQEYQAMEHILDAAGDLGPVDLATRLGLAVPTTSELLDRLESAGHVLRQRDARDGRRVRLVPTASAIAAIVAEITPVLGELDELVDNYSSEEQAVILSFLQDAARTFQDRIQPTDDETSPSAGG